MTDLQCPAIFELVPAGADADHALHDAAGAWAELEALADLHRGETVPVSVPTSLVPLLPEALRPPARWEVDADGWRRLPDAPGVQEASGAPGELVVVPANEARWEDLQAVLGCRGQAAVCQCQRFKLAPRESFRSVPVAERAGRLREQTDAGQPDAGTTSGLVAYLDGEPAGWCAVEPRPAYPGLLRVYRVPWQGRSEDKLDDGVWAVTCLFTRAGCRRRGVSRALARAAVGFARDRGARALEAYPIVPEPGQQITWGEELVGLPSVYASAGFVEVHRPTPRRAVMRVDLRAGSGAGSGAG